MWEQSEILTAPGMGSVFLGLVLICYLVITKIIKARKENNDAPPLGAEGSAPSMAVGVNNTTGVVAAITAAVTEYHKHNF